MKIENIKPIPKYILNLIHKEDLHSYPKPLATRRFYAYLTKNNNELVKVTVAVKNKGKDWYCKQVAVHGINSKECFIKDIEYYWIAGYTVGWYEQGLQKNPKWFECQEWCTADDKYFDPVAPIINKEYALKFEQYKYSLANEYLYCDLMKYLRLYAKYPQAEYLMKLDLQYYATSITILKLIGKDKNFRKWIIKNKKDLFQNYYYVNTIIQAYKENKSIAKMQNYQEFCKRFMKNENYKRIKDLFGGNIEHFFDYISTQNTNESSYVDYLNACEYLNLDMSLNKNKTPHNFKYWHDLRIDEYNSAKIQADKKARKEFYIKFNKIANKYISLQRNLKDNYITIIAKSPAELIFEGEKLNHCVGRMNYDQKFAKEQSLIFFIRNKEKPEKPFVTVEYDLHKHKVLQCYGDSDSTPEQSVLNYVNKVWLPYANRKLKQINI